MDDEIDYGFVLDLIETGQLDDQADAIAEAIYARQRFIRDMRAANNKMMFGPGTKVRFTSIKPQYLRGITGVVSNRMPNRPRDIMVDVDPSCYHRLGRYGRQLSVPASALEEINL